jgi:hypothetical protein
MPEPMAGVGTVVMTETPELPATDGFEMPSGCTIDLYFFLVDSTCLPLLPTPPHYSPFST